MENNEINSKPTHTWVTKLGEKIDSHFAKFNKKFDAHWVKEWKILDNVIKRLDWTDDKLVQLEKDVANHKGLLMLIWLAIIILLFKVFK